METNLRNATVKGSHIFSDAGTHPTSERWTVFSGVFVRRHLSKKKQTKRNIYFYLTCLIELMRRIDEEETNNNA